MERETYITTTDALIIGAIMGVLVVLAFAAGVAVGSAQEGLLRSVPDDTTWGALAEALFEDLNAYDYGNTVDVEACHQALEEMFEGWWEKVTPDDVNDFKLDPDEEDEDGDSVYLYVVIYNARK